MELPAAIKLLKEKPELVSKLKQKDVLIVQHLHPDTLAFIQALIEVQIPVRAVIGIQYSAKQEVVHELANLGVDVVVPDWQKIPDVVLRHVEESQNAGRKSVIHEVGGYCAQLAHENERFAENCVGVVEETKQGLWRYEKVGTLLVPVIQFADASLKKFESEFVGRAVVRSLDEDLAYLGKSIETIDIGVIGFGHIGSGVARSLRRRACRVWCYDIKPVRMMDAVSQGFRCAESAELLANCHAIIGATGSGCISPAAIANLRDQVLLASASSRDLEFPIAKIQEQCVEKAELGPYVTEYRLKTKKRIRVSSGGFPVNFRTLSLPPSFGDLMFCQVLAGFEGILKDNYAPGLHGLGKTDQDSIAATWWNCYAARDAVTGYWDICC